MEGCTLTLTLLCQAHCAHEHVRASIKRCSGNRPERLLSLDGDGPTDLEEASRRGRSQEVKV